MQPSAPGRVLHGRCSSVRAHISLIAAHPKKPQLLLRRLFGARIKLTLNPKEGYDRAPLHTYYREVIMLPESAQHEDENALEEEVEGGKDDSKRAVEPRNNAANSAVSTNKQLSLISRLLSHPVDKLQSISNHLITIDRPSLVTAKLDVLPNWLVSAWESAEDLDNLVITREANANRAKTSATGEKGITATYILKQMYVEGAGIVVDQWGNQREYAAGLELGLYRDAGVRIQRPVADTRVMNNLGYYQLAAGPGMYSVRVMPRSKHRYELDVGKSWQEEFQEKRAKKKREVLEVKQAASAAESAGSDDGFDEGGNLVVSGSHDYGNIDKFNIDADYEPTAYDTVFEREFNRYPHESDEEAQVRKIKIKKRKQMEDVEKAMVDISGKERNSGRSTTTSTTSAFSLKSKDSNLKKPKEIRLIVDSYITPPQVVQVKDSPDMHVLTELKHGGWANKTPQEQAVTNEMVRRVELEMQRRSEVANRDEMREIAMVLGEEGEEGGVDSLSLSSQGGRDIAEEDDLDAKPSKEDSKHDSPSPEVHDSEDSPISDAEDFDEKEDEDSKALDDEIPLFDADFQEQLWGMSEEEAEKKRKEYLEKNKTKVKEIKEKWREEKRRRREREKKRSEEIAKQRKEALADKRRFEESLRKTEEERNYRELELSGKVAIRKAKGRRNNYSGETVHIFSVASGHLYEELLSIMILSVRRNTRSPLHFWFIDTFLSPKFKTFLPILAEKVGFEFSFVSYKWPSWLHFQEDKQRLIWAYKILFLDVLFPLSVERILFIDADQIVRADVRELNQVDLKGNVYGFVPMGDSNKDTEGFRFWKTGYWKSHLDGTPYHISALFAVDLKLFRERNAGDMLRQIYNQLAPDPNSLSNLDQDLPNFAQQKGIPIFSLPKEWLFCGTWCDEKELRTAKTIDLCQNPMTKEPKTEMAKRITPEWVGYRDSVRALARAVEEGTVARHVVELGPLGEGVPMIMQQDSDVGSESDASLASNSTSTTASESTESSKKKQKRKKKLAPKYVRANVQKDDVVEETVEDSVYSDSAGTDPTTIKRSDAVPDEIPSDVSTGCSEGGKCVDSDILDGVKTKVSSDNAAGGAATGERLESR